MPVLVPPLEPPLVHMSVGVGLPLVLVLVLVLGVLVLVSGMSVLVGHLTVRVVEVAVNRLLRVLLGHELGPSDFSMS